MEEYKKRLRTQLYEEKDRVFSPNEEYSPEIKRISIQLSLDMLKILMSGEAIILESNDPYLEVKIGPDFEDY